MELAQLLITPGTLLTAFIFFWKQARANNDDLKRELKEDLKRAFVSIDELKRELKEDLKQVRTDNDEMKREWKEELGFVRKEISSIRVEMHDMNGRIGRVEGLLVAADSK